MADQQRNSIKSHLVAAGAAFAVYFCMYAFRKPFTATTYDNQTLAGLSLKSVLVLSQITGYMVSKFIGVKVVSELPRSRRAVAILVLIGIAELALVGFAFAPVPLKVVMLFLNGLPLGMVFGLVLAFLEGRRQTEALAAGLCASFIISSGVVKSVGQWLVESQQVNDFLMPCLTGLIFLPPLFLFVWLLQRTPEPEDRDREIRSARPAMTRDERRTFFRSYAGGLTLLLVVYSILTVTRTLRDDFGVEIWQRLGVKEKPEVFGMSETIVGFVVTALNAFAIVFVRNLTALRAATGLMITGFGIAIGATLIQWQGQLSPFWFMVLCGIGLYLPYVAFHTTVFERIVAESRQPGNLGFLMYLADSIGYMCYAAIMFAGTLSGDQKKQIDILAFFQHSMVWGSLVSIGALLGALIYFSRRFTSVQATATESA